MTQNQNTFDFKLLGKKDLPLLFQWMHIPHVSKWWQSPTDWPTFQTKYRTQLDNPYRSSYMVYLNQIPIGYIQYYQANKFPEWHNQAKDTYGIDILIGEMNYIGKGYGTLIIKQFIKMLCANPEIRKIIADPALDNKAAIACYEKAGFKKIAEITRENTQYLLMEFGCLS
ncbi:MAG: GNAT family N-acetyltransferase [Candidatus Babeliaceae bacterium]